MNTSTVSLSMLCLLSVLASPSPVTITTTVSPHSQEVLIAHPFSDVQTTTSHSEQTNTTMTNITETTGRAASPRELSASTHSITTSTSGTVGGKPDSTPQSAIPKKTESKISAEGMVILFLVIIVGVLFLIWWLWRPQGRRSVSQLMQRARDATRAAGGQLRLWLWPHRRDSGAEECASDEGSSLGGTEMGEGLKAGAAKEGQTDGHSSTDGEKEDMQEERAARMEKQPYSDIMIEDNENQEDGES